MKTEFWYIVADVGGERRYVARDGSYTASFDDALRFESGDAAEFYRTAMSEKVSAKVLPFTP